MDNTPQTPHTPRPSASQAGQATVDTPWIVSGVVIVIAVVIAILAIAGTGPFSHATSSTPSNNPISQPSSTAWSAVFLGDNEVFFGHLKNINSSQLELTGVYYLQKTTSGSNPNQTQNQQSQLSLAGLVGNQIQCPTDDLVINRNAVLYYQQLQPSSYVVTKLTQLVQTPQKCVQPASASPTPAAN